MVMAFFRVLLLAALLDGGRSEELCENCDAFNSAFLQLEVSKEKTSKSSKYWYPTKSVDEHRSGRSSVKGMFPLPPTLAWEFTSKGTGTVVVDDKSNVYIGSEEGKIYSLDEHGQKRWEANGTGEDCQNPALFAGTLYIACSDGSALAIDMMTGKRLWQSKVSASLPLDTFNLGVSEDYVFMPAGSEDTNLYAGPFEEPLQIGSPGMALLRRADGQVLWKFNLTAEGETQEELLPCMLSDSVVFSGTQGTIHRLRYEDGHVMWKTHVDPWVAVAQVSCTDGKVLVGLGNATVDPNEPGSPSGVGGGVQALDIETGKTLWTISLPHSVYTPIAVGKIHGHEGTAIIAGMGRPAQYPNVTTFNHTLWAVEPITGKKIWSFDTPSFTARGSAGSTLEEMCEPQSWSAPSISTDGTVYVSWSYAGVTYALRDANKDGVCDPDDPEEVSSYDFGIGNYGGPALAPGMLVVRTCHGPRAFKAPHQ